MLWTNLLRHLTGEAKLEEVAQRAAARTRHAVWERVRWQIGSMGPAEARGYVRARSALVVHREVDRLLRHDGLVRRSARSRLIELTTEAVLRIVADQTIFAAPLPIAPAQPAMLRRAA